MKFEGDIPDRYRDSIEKALQTIGAVGTDEQKMIAGLILDSQMIVRARPVKELNASGITGLIDSAATSEKISQGAISLIDAFGEIYIAIAYETIDTGGQRGCEGTFVHEGRHVYDFARVIASYSDAAVNPLSVFDPTLFELEWEAHRTSGEYMLAVNRPEYIEEGLGLMILGRHSGKCCVDSAGIAQRLSSSYGLKRSIAEGPLTSELLGLRI
ncbi:MAG: hypothetical protein C4324_09265 [Blastocatellia bacterium]